MKFQTHNDKEIDICGTCLQGYIQATRAQLEAMFGAPATDHDEPKITTVWDIEFEDGTIVSIYDWKRYELGAPAADEVCGWHVGGKRKQDTWKLHDEFRAFHNLSARAA